MGDRDRRISLDPMEWESVKKAVGKGAAAVKAKPKKKGSPSKGPSKGTKGSGSRK